MNELICDRRQEVEKKSRNSCMFCPLQSQSVLMVGVSIFSLNQVSFYFRPHISGGDSFDLDVSQIAVTVIAKLGW